VDTSSKLRGHVVGNQSTWHYHGSQVDVENTHQPLGSKKVVGQMKALLQGSVDEYREAFCHASDFNPEVRAMLESITVNQTNMRRIDTNFLGIASSYQGDSDSSDDEEEATVVVGAEGTPGFGRYARAERTWIQKHEKPSNFTMCLFSRTCNAHTKCFMLLALSCVLLATGVPRSTWSLLLSQGIVYKREAIEQTLLDIGKECME